MAEPVVERRRSGRGREAAASLLRRGGSSGKGSPVGMNGTGTSIEVVERGIPVDTGGRGTSIAIVERGMLVGAGRVIVLGKGGREAPIDRGGKGALLGHGEVADHPVLCGRRDPLGGGDGNVVSIGSGSEVSWVGMAEAMATQLTTARTMSSLILCTETVGPEVKG